MPTLEEIRTKNESDLAGILRKIEGLRRRGEKIIFVSGVFNVIHPGHLRLLKFAREQGGCLVVGVHANALAPTAVVDERDRLDGVGAVAYVDHSFLMVEDPATTIRRLRPDVVIKGREWAEQENPEDAAVREYGGKLLFSSGEVTFSSLDLIREEFRRRGHIDLRPTDGYLDRHGIRPGDAAALLRGFGELNVAVLGDTIVDEYIVCEALGMSQEDPVVVVRPLATERFVGGAAIVALHARALGANVRFASVVGSDPAAAFVEERLRAEGVESRCLTDESRPTTVKQRFLSQGKKLLRVSYLREHSLSRELAGEMAQRLRDALDGADLIIFSDFNYGFLCDEVREAAIRIGRSRRIRMAADCQSSSQIGDVTRYVGMDLVTPTEREARLALRDKESGLVVLARELEQKMRAGDVLLKIGGEGLIVHHSKGDAYETDRLPALNPDPKDVMGAGDALLVGASMTLAADGDIWTAAFIGDICAAAEVDALGNQPLQREAILALIREQALVEARSRSSHGKTINPGPCLDQPRRSASGGAPRSRLPWPRREGALNPSP